MPLSVIQQPNGRFTVWRRNPGCFVLVDASMDAVRRLVAAEGGGGTLGADRLLKRACRAPGYPPPLRLADMVEECEAFNPDDMLLPMVKAMLREVA